MKKRKQKERLVLIDSHALIHRAFHALPQLNTQQGELVNAVFGFLSILLSAVKELQPDYVAAAFDLPKPTFRHQQFKDYKATRAKTPDELSNQIGRVREALAAFCVPVFEKEGFEADDVLGTIVEKLKDKKDLEIFIVTGDLDTLQLVKKNKVFVFAPKRGIKETQIYDEAAVKKRFGLGPKQLTDFKGLKGDPSDNIPGVPGVGEKTAASLLKEFGNLKALFQRLEKSNLPEKLKQRLRENKDQAFFSKELAQIHKRVPIAFGLKEARWQELDKSKVKKFLEELRFFSLLKRLPEVFGQGFEINQKKRELVDDVTVKQINLLLKQKILSPELGKIEKALTPILRKMEQRGILLNAKHLEALGQKVEKSLKVLERRIHRLAGRSFNINSSQQLSEILFQQLKIETKGLRKTPGRVVSTAAPELSKLKQAHPIVEKILEFRELAKLKNTYIDSLPKLVGPDKKIHTQFDQLGTATGRISSKNPNLQNIPIRTSLGQEIRRAFVPSPGFVFLSADYSQIELRVVASLAGDKKMTRLLKQGHDVHQATASTVFGMAESRIDKKMRRVAKILNFGVIYGMSLQGFAEAADVSRQEAKNFVSSYFSKFSGVADYIEKTKEKARRLGYVKTLFGRRRFLPEINSSAWNLKAAAERMAINMPIQGTAADIIKMAMVALDQGIDQKCCRMVLQIHDELLFEIKNEKTLIKKQSELIKNIMEKKNQLKVPLVVNLKSGKNWGEL